MRFYVDQLGFGLVVDESYEAGGRWVAVAPPDGSTVLALITPKRKSEEYKLIGRCRHAVLVTEDVVAKFEEWRQRGVLFHHPPQTTLWGSISTTVASALSIGTINFFLLMILVVLALTRLDPANYAYVHVPLVGGAPFDPALVGLGPDVGHMVWGGIDPLPWFRRHMDRVKSIHIKDMNADVLRRCREEKEPQLARLTRAAFPAAVESASSACNPSEPRSS